jgi:peptide deformylase
LTIQSVRLFGDPVLRTPAEPVVDFDKELRRLVKDLLDTMTSRTAPAWPRRRSASGCGSSRSTSTRSSGT